jgi:hypothetical protein
MTASVKKSIADMELKLCEKLGKSMSACYYLSTLLLVIIHTKKNKIVFIPKISITFQVFAFPTASKFSKFRLLVA